MSQAGFCQKHGPFESDSGRCPYCARETNQISAPPPLDGLPTDPWGGQERRPKAAFDEDETDLGSLARRRGEEEDVTELPERRRGRWDDEETVVEHAEEGVLGFLIVKQGMRRGQVYRIKDGTTIGRNETDIILKDPKVSRPHAKFTLEAEQFVVWDFGSENGTFVNDERIRGATPLAENDTIKIGDTILVLKVLQ